jgi:hypothetical protein
MESLAEESQPHYYELSHSEFVKPKNRKGSLRAFNAYEQLDETEVDVVHKVFNNLMYLNVYRSPDASVLCLRSSL